MISGQRESIGVTRRVSIIITHVHGMEYGYLPSAWGGACPPFLCPPKEFLRDFQNLVDTLNTIKPSSFNEGFYALLRGGR
jgi:hypothetical protein